MKKLISCLLVVTMLLTVVGTFAESTGAGRFGEYGVLRRFLKETDLQTKDIALQVESEGKVSDLVIRVDGDNIHLVSRNDAVEDSHVQLNPTGIYVSAEGNVMLLRYATITTVMQNIVNELNAVLDEAIKSIPEDAIPTEVEMKKAVNELAILASAVEQQEQADAATLSAAAMAFANKFKPEYILDVVEEEGSVTISLRSEAFATAFAEAIDELMLNPDLAELVDRQAALTGTKEFAKYQKEWAKHREATLEAIRTMESTDVIDENGHWVSHFQISEDASAIKILMCDTDAWIDAENGNAQIAVALGFKDEAPLMVYELAVDQNSYREKLSSGDSMTEVKVYYENEQISSGTVSTVIEGNEQLWAEFGPDYLYMRGPKGGISTSVRETWTGKTRYELVAETADGKEATITVDFYEDGDSLVCEMNTSESEQPAIFRISRIDKLDIADLGAAENIKEITVDQINAALESIFKLVTNIEAPASVGTPEEAAATTEDETSETVKLDVTLPEDNGMFGIYKWVEMENIGVTVYLILWDDGTGTIDFVGDGTIRFVFYNDETMQVADEGAVPQKYAYADGKLTWTYTDESGEHTSTFIKLTAEERAAYEALGVGSIAENGKKQEDIRR